ncbi:hypothetical protein LXD69_07215 [Flavobacterium sediminilitoris]|uniref:Uncharacterized protein n=1 Tax=Flavobacterium sediminilitoris TaxID=2024526 RepID=A0ABY4HRR0_9FLAO|nr:MULTISPECIES: hypothetical protein [Flavobacterium]UOX35300.1 hypothetical protein LXD69_07215 [Flavobacterium sediminilitoris]
MSEKAIITVYFPVKPHVYKFLQKKVGEKMVVTKNNFYGNLVLDVLSKKYSVLEAVTDDLVFPVDISLRYITNYGVFIDQNIIRKFNAQIDKQFREELRSYVSINASANNLPKNEAIRQFIFHYNITEEDIKMETLIKDIVRNVVL